jgi:hypothetical protein
MLGDFQRWGSASRRGGDHYQERRVNTSSEIASLSWRDCVNLSDLTEEELADLATRDEEFDFEGANLDHYLVITPGGRLSVRAELGSDIRSALDAGDVRRSGNLKHVLLRFMQIYTARTA